VPFLQAVVTRFVANVAVVAVVAIVAIVMNKKGMWAKNFVLLAHSDWCTISHGVITRTITKGFYAKGTFSQTSADSSNGSLFTAIA